MPQAKRPGRQGEARRRGNGRGALHGGYSEDEDKETEGQRPKGLGKGAREDEGGRAHKGQG